LLAAARGHAARALLLAGGAASCREALGLTTTPLARDIFESKLAVARQEMTEAAAEEAWQRGYHMSREAITTLALRDSAALTAS
jgi:hypothetical protein